LPYSLTANFQAIGKEKQYGIGIIETLYYLADPAAKRKKKYKAGNSRMFTRILFTF
jgi:hypothetical protein